ncbi:hypothetical protein CcaverHIS631_0503840 [Cutaneotrichosporon cavernicola]|nr:hypothetical protein CcaverHIS631_0503840 [Cutaneotrichosporon cavernicola]
MSEAPSTTEADKLAPPPKPNRSSSSASNHSNNSSRRGHRSPGSSSSVSRSNSHSSQGNTSSAPRKGGNTTTISGGTSLGGGAKSGGEHKRTRTKGGAAADAGSRSLSRRSSTKQGPQRPSSSAADASVADKLERAVTPSDQPKVLSLHAATSPPVDAMEAAVTAATKKHHETHGQDALSSLQRMISDLKAISPSNSNPSSRQVSGKMTESPQSPVSGSAAPVAIPGASSPTATTSTKLKADAPSFTPGSFRAGQSPTAPTSQPPPQARSGGGNSNRRGQSVSYGFNQSFAAPAFPGGIPHFPGADVQPGQSVDFSQFSQHNDVFQQQQALLAAQQLQLQLLQAQLMQQQMTGQQQRDAGFIAPRFQALAAQRAALQQQQQQQQSVHMAEAQRMFELQQQQQMLLAQQQPIPETAPVFDEESPEHSPTAVGPTGRPQLNPNFTFGKRRESSSDKPLVVVDRSAGVGGAAATGLAGLAARAHKRSGSDMNQQDTEQVELQRQIEALQAKQKELLTRGGSVTKPNLDALKGQATARHRRTQSQVSSTSPTAEMQQFMLPPGEEGDKLGRSFQDTHRSLAAAPSAPHNRRHSMNVLAKGSGGGMGFGDYVEDGGSISIPPGGFQHHRSGSRGGFESGNWRMNGGGPNATSDLASAQAQLASLAQFRAAAGSGHAKMASFSFPNMLPNLLAATTLQNPSGQSSLWQQQQAFQMQLQQNQQGPQRKSLFAPYLPQASLPPLLSAGKLVVGILRVNKKNRSDAYVATDVLDADIYICGSKDRNRALEGDIVAVELLDVDEVWGTKKDKEEKKRKKEESYDVKPATAKRLEKKKDDIEVEGQSLTLFDDEEVNDETKPTYAGHVVAVVERMPGQLFSGQLGVLRPSSAATKEKQEAERREREGDRPREEKKEPEPRPKIVWFKPTDKRVPLIAIPTEQAPADFIENPEAHANKLFVATIKRWPITSLHPFGTLVEELGPIGDSEVETSAILKDCNFPTEEFSDVALKCLPPLPWTIPEREFEVRVDLREDCVFTIDPANSRDLDDALSITANDDNTHTVGVHIADVSYFLKANTALDRDARKRAASVYLVQRAVPMLPPLLSEQLCSLVPDTERLAFSAFFVIDKDGNAVEKSYRRTIIKSSARLSYADAAGVIAGGKLDSSKVTGKHSADKVAENVRLLHDIAGKLRNKRIEDGAMLSQRARLTFLLDNDGEPVDVSVQEKNDANMVIEEFTVLTNTSIAAVIANGLAEQALLRRQEPPNDRRLGAFVERAKVLGFDLDPTNAGTLQKSFNKITDKEAVFCLSLLEKKTMQPARYFCTGMLDIAKYSHWALNAPLYTHFTSPIRRYADVLVHRMLDACLSSHSANDVKFLMDRDQVAKCAQQCNMKRQSARLAEDQSAHLHLCILVGNLSAKYGPVIRHARVTGVYDQAFDVVIPEFSLEKRVHLDKLPLENSVFDEHTNVLSLYWKSQDVLSFLTPSADDEHLLKIKQHTDSRASGASTTRTTDTTALFDDGNLSSQVQKSNSRAPLKFECLRKTDAGHRIQDIKEFSSIPVIVTADMSKSPPVLVVYACNPYAA